MMSIYTQTITTHLIENKPELFSSKLGLFREIDYILC